MSPLAKLTAIDVCAGAGGWSCAARGLPIQIVAAFDIWDKACKTYELNNPGTTVVCGDLREKKIQRRVLELAKGVDLVLGGIPCEWISIYRNLEKVSPEEMKAERETLDSVLALVKKIGPTYWCLEDVKGLARHLPPLTPFVEIDAQEYSGQRRKRIYVGNFPPPARSCSPLLLKDYIRPGPYRIGPRAAHREPRTNCTFRKDASLAAYADRKSMTVCSISSRRDAELVFVDEKLPGGKRQFEWQEMAALQGFPQDFVFYGSPSDVSEMVGRAVQIDTGRAILASIVADWQAKRAPQKEAAAS